MKEGGVELQRVVSARSNVLQLLLAGVSAKPEIESALGISRATVSRAFHQLEEVGAIRPGPDGYEVTLLGQICYEECKRFESICGALAEAEPLLLSLPPGTPFEPSLLIDSEVHLSTDIAPLEPRRCLESIVRDGNSVKTVSAVVLPQSVEFLHDRIVNYGLTADWVIREAGLSVLLTQYGDEVQEALATGNCRIWSLDDSEPSYELTIVDTTAIWLGFFDSGGGFRGGVINATERAVAECLDVFEGYRNRATRVDPGLVRGSRAG